MDGWTDAMMDGRFSASWLATNLSASFRPFAGLGETERVVPCREKGQAFRGQTPQDYFPQRPLDLSSPSLSDL